MWAFRFLLCIFLFVGVQTGERLGAPAHAQSSDDVNALGQHVIQFLKIGDYAQALPLALRAVALAESLQGPNHRQVSATLNDLADVYRVLGRYAEAEPIYRRSLAMREKALSADQPDLATSLNNLGHLSSMQGRLKEAETLFTRALEIREKVLPAGHRDIATSLNNLGFLYGALGRVKEAEQLCKRALEMRETMLPAGDPDIALSLLTLADLYGAQRRFADAEPLYKRSLQMRETALPAGHPDIATSLNNLAFLYHLQGRLAEAEALYKRASTIYEKALPDGHPDAATNLTNLVSLYLDQRRITETEPFYERALATYASPAALDALAGLYQAHGRYAKAEPLFKRALALAEHQFDPDHLEVANRLNNLALNYQTLGRITESEPLLKRALAIREKVFPAGHPVIAQGFNNLAGLYETQGRWSEAEPLYKRAVEIWEKEMPPGHPDIALGLNNLASLFNQQGRFAEAEPLLKRALEINEKALPPGHANVVRILDNLAGLYEEQGRYAESEPLIKRVLEMREQTLPVDHPDIARSLHRLATHYQKQGRFADARPLHKRALLINETAWPADHPEIAESLNNLATATGGKEAESLYKRALEIWERTLPPDHPNIAQGLNNLAYHYQGQGRLKEVAPLINRALAIREKTLPAGHPDIAVSLNNLAYFHFVQGRFAEAEPLYRRALDIHEKTLPSGHSTIGVALADLGVLALARKDWPKALAYGDRAASIFTTHSDNQLRRTSDYFRFSVLAAHRAGGSDPGLRERSFEKAQWAQRSEAAAALGQMAARQAKGGGELGGLVREAQDLDRQVRIADRRLSGALGRSESTLADVVRREIAGIEVRLKVIRQRLATEFREYAALADPKPLSIAEAQALLRPDEALLLFLDTPEVPEVSGIPAESFAWGLTKTDARWVKLLLSPKEINEHVQALRCGLDRDGEWQWSANRQRWMGRRKSCTTLRPDGLANDEMPPFDLARAHALYQALLGPFQDLVKDKHLLVAPSGALAQLPFGVLVAEAPAPGRQTAFALYQAAWLGRRQAITVLPSVSSLKALREFAQPSKATRPLIGFGNPLLDGDPRDLDHAFRAKQARDKQTCPNLPSDIAGVAMAPSSRNADVRAVFREGKVDVAAVRGTAPLPETADELCAVARALAAKENDIHLGAKATKTAVMRGSQDGTLARYRVVHFATHGLLAGETEWFARGRAEPALILTPPPDGTDAKQLEHDDGLLTASDVSQLRLDADWVVLSACNTAGADALAGGEALSGLARAFFYAGARALMVSHWYVDSNAAVKLITKAFAELNTDPTMGRSEALRRSMQTLITDKTGANNAHPAVWAPFVVVGEGAR